MSAGIESNTLRDPIQGLVVEDGWMDVSTAYISTIKYYALIKLIVQKALKVN